VIDVKVDGLRLELRGSLDADGASEFLNAVVRAGRDLQVDASGLDELDGAGLTALVLARRACREHGHSFVLVGLGPDAARRLRARHDLARLFGAQDPAPSIDSPSCPPITPAAPDERTRRRRFPFVRAHHR
jgi:anti-anti-sigma regulatory factor